MFIQAAGTEDAERCGEPDTVAVCDGLCVLHTHTLERDPVSVCVRACPTHTSRGMRHICNAKASTSFILICTI